MYEPYDEERIGIPPASVYKRLKELEAANAALIIALEATLTYLEHPDVQALPFALPVSNITRLTKATIKFAKLTTRP